MSILIVGSVAIDSVKTPRGYHDEMLGGSATYFSLAASHFTPVNIVAVVGNDFPEKYRDLFISKGIDLEGLQVVEGRTFRWKGEYQGSMNEARTLETQLNVFEGFQPEIPEELKNCQWVFLGNIDPVLQNRVLTQIRNPRFIALDTMNYWISGSRDALLKTLRKIDLLTINETEIRLLTDQNNIPLAAKMVQELGPRSIIIKRGEYGSLLLHANHWFYVPGYPEETVVDPTGAGDSFAGGFMGALAREGIVNDKTLRRAMIYGSVMASYNITAFGPWKLVELSEQLIESRYQSFLELISLEAFC